MILTHHSAILVIYTDLAINSHPSSISRSNVVLNIKAGGTYGDVENIKKGLVSLNAFADANVAANAAAIERRIFSGLAVWLMLKERTS